MSPINNSQKLSMSFRAGLMALLAWMSIDSPMCAVSAFAQENSSAEKKKSNDLRPISPESLARPAPKNYLLAAGDILGVYVEGIVGDKNLPLPVREQTVMIGNTVEKLPPAVGFPIPVGPNGTIALPQIEPLKVAGMTTSEVHDAMRKVYQSLEKVHGNKILVTLIRPRLFQIQVIRQELLRNNGKDARRGTAAYIDLPAYQNDVFNALMRTGGVPDFDQFNLKIYRNADTKDTKTIEIPTQVPSGQSLPFPPEAIILQSGDILFVEAKEQFASPRY